MSSPTPSPAQVVTPDPSSLPPPHFLGVNDLNLPDYDGMDGGTVTDVHMVPVNEDEAVSSITDVQLPFSLSCHDHDNGSVPSDGPLLVRCPKGNLLRLGFTSCDLVACNWQLLPSSFLLPQLPPEFTGTFGSIYTGGGLVMMEKFAKQKYHLVVSNPSNKSQRMLPPMMDFPSPDILGIFVDPVTMGYKIPVIQRKFNIKEIDLVIMQEYDSISNSWEFAGQWRNRFQVEPIGAAYVNGTLFFLTFYRQASIEGEGEEQVHHVYYLCDLVWERLNLPVGLGFYGFPAIFEHQGRLMLGGGIHDQDMENSTGLQSVHIWEHDWDVMKWMEVCTMPDTWIEELNKCPPEDRRCTFEIITGGNFVCIASSNGRVAKCDITQNVWSWLPKCDLEKYSDGDKNLILERQPDISA